MKDIIKNYVEEFNKNDIEYYKQDIDNAHALEWMIENIPHLSCSDKELEKIYYFRWWTARKHIKSTSDGYIITEFLPKVPWSGRHNSIVAPVGHHIAEFRWLRNGKAYLSDYIRFWLTEKGNTFDYTTWLISSVYDFCEFENDFSLAIDNYGLLINFYEKVKAERKTASGLFWSIDNTDAMEFSISGITPDFRVQKGLRTTLNSYMYANALALSKIAEMKGIKSDSVKYYNEAQKIKSLINELLWDGEFYKSIHSDNIVNEKSVNARESISEEQNVKELAGFIPWSFGIPPQKYCKMFTDLKDKNRFNHKYGFTTADQTHKRYLYKHEHECLWNGYIWPYATSQTFNAIIKFNNEYKNGILSKEDIFSMFKTYAGSHYRICEDGKKVCWIDEVKSPADNSWSSREILKNRGWQASMGGKERGKDYNHSTFADILFRGILGIDIKNGKITVKPNAPDNFEFKLQNLWHDGKEYKITFDKKNGASIL